MLKKINNINVLEAYMIDRNILSQNELASKARLSPVTVSRLFSGKSVSARTIKKITDALGVNFFDIVEK